MLTVIFDLDGTLVDTAPDLIDTLNLILAREGLPNMPYDDARRMIGGGAKGLIEKALAAEGRDDLKADLDRMYHAFIAHYADHIADRSRPFPALKSALDDLVGEKMRLAVCTNKLEWLSVRLLETLGLAGYFSAICGQDTFGVQKPDPEILRRTILRAGGEVSRAIMVGDSGTDIRAARAANLPVIAVAFGYSEVPIATLEPDHLISSFADLRSAIRAFEAGLVPQKAGGPRSSD